MLVVSVSDGVSFAPHMARVCGWVAGQWMPMCFLMYEFVGMFLDV